MSILPLVKKIINTSVFLILLCVGILSFSIGTLAQSTIVLPANSTVNATSLVDQALNSTAALSSALFPNCTPNPQTLRTGSNASNSTVLINCLKDVVNLLLIVAILWVVIDIATTNLGVVIRSGEGGESPVTAARRKIEKAVIGIFLIGGVALLLNLFASNLLNFSLPRINTTTTQQGGALFVSALSPPESAQGRPVSIRRTDIPDDRNKDTLSNDPKDKLTINNRIKAILESNVLGARVTNSALLDLDWFGISRGASPSKDDNVPIHHLVAAAGIASNWGNTTTARYRCANDKQNYFLVLLTESEIRADTTLARDINKTDFDRCRLYRDYTTQSSASQVAIDFAAFYRANLKQRQACGIWEVHFGLVPNMTQSEKDNICGGSASSPGYKTIADKLIPKLFV